MGKILHEVLRDASADVPYCSHSNLLFRSLAFAGTSVVTVHRDGQATFALFGLLSLRP